MDLNYQIQNLFHSTGICVSPETNLLGDELLVEFVRQILWQNKKLSEDRMRAFGFLKLIFGSDAFNSDDELTLTESEAKIWLQANYNPNRVLTESPTLGQVHSELFSVYCEMIRTYAVGDVEKQAVLDDMIAEGIAGPPRFVRCWDTFDVNTKLALMIMRMILDRTGMLG